jgi:hypothetical protein
MPENERPSIAHAERHELEAAVAAARADPRPDVPHEAVRAQMIEELRQIREEAAALRE